MWLLGVLPATAHDVGLMTLRFEELGDNRYQIEYIAQPGSPESAAPPVLSSPLTWEQEPELPGGLVRLVFATDGKPLSSEDQITLPWRVNGVMVQAFWRSGETARHLFTLTKEGVVIRIGDLRAGTGSVGEAAKHYSQLGMEHILTGWDHLMFIVGLLLLIRGWRMTLATITAFTLGHSLTLALGTFGVVQVELDLVDALVALSIIVLAVEVLHFKQGRVGLTARKPWLIAFAFGLIHGLGFAWALAALGLPRQELPQALLFFNLGVELGQLGVVVLWYSVVAIAGKLSFRLPERWAKAPAYALGIIATWLFLDRTMTMFW
jgi:hypothetical protein